MPGRCREPKSPAAGRHLPFNVPMWQIRLRNQVTSQNLECAPNAIRTYTFCHSLLCLLCVSSPAMVLQTSHCLLHARCCPRKLDSDGCVCFCLCSSSALCPQLHGVVGPSEMLNPFKLFKLRCWSRVGFVSEIWS